MSLTPQDIQTKQFHVRFRGFDVEEVDAFLERIAEEFLILSQENKQLKDRLEVLSRNIEQHKEQEKRFQDAILSAHAIADEMKERSRAESDALLHNAREAVKNLQDKAHEEITGLESTIVNLKELKDRVHDDVRTLLETYLERLEGVAKGGPAIDYKPQQPEKQSLPEPENEPEDADQALTAQEAEAGAPEMEAHEGPKVVVEELSEDEEQGVPDLDGDVLYSVDDPLDELESNLNSQKDRE